MSLVRLNAVLAAAGFCAFALWMVALAVFAKRLHLPFPTGFAIIFYGVLYLLYIGFVDLIASVGWKVARRLWPIQVTRDTIRPWYRSFRALCVMPFVAVPFFVPAGTVVAGLLEGPYRPVALSEIPGWYTATVRDHRIELTLRRDRSYDLAVEIGGRPVRSGGPNWIYQPVNAEFEQEPKVRLEGLTGEIDRITKQSFPPVSAYYYAIHSRGRVLLCWGDFDAPDCLHPSALDEKGPHPSRGNRSSSSGGKP